MELVHNGYSLHGREFFINDDQGQPTGEVAYVAGTNQLNILDQGEYKPYAYSNRVCRFNRFEVRFVTGGIEIWEGAERLIGFGVHPEIERQLTPDSFQRKAPVVSGLRTSVITTDDACEALSIRYDVETEDLKSTINIEVGGRRHMIFGCRNTAKVLGRRQRATVEFDQEASLVASNGPTGRQIYRFADRRSKWMWDQIEDADHRVEVAAGRTRVHLKEQVYNSIEPVRIQPDVWSDATAGDDCVETNDRTVYNDWGDNYWGHESGTYNHMDVGVGWTSVSVPAGCTISTGSYIQITCSANVGSGAQAGEVQVEDSRTPVAYDSSARPSQRTYHPTGSAAWTLNQGSGTANSPELSSVIQQRIDDDHVANDAMAFRIYSGTGLSGDNYQGFSELSVTLYIVYTPAGSGYTLALDSVAYAVAATAVSLERGYALDLDPVSFAVTPQDVSLERGYAIDADPVSFAVTISDVDLERGYLLSADVVAFLVTAQDVTLTYSGGGYELTIESVSYAVSATDVDLLLGHLLSAESAGYALTVQDVGLTWSGETAVFTAAQLAEIKRIHRNAMIVDNLF